MTEQTLIIIKPDALNRTVVGEIIHRFERKGLKIVGMKMTHLTEDVLEEHYSHLKDKPFYPILMKFMQAAPSLLMILEGNNVVEVVRKMAGPTHGAEAEAGTIRGDYSLSNQNNVVHASDSVENAEKEIKRFFKPEEIFDYKRIDTEMIYSEQELSEQKKLR
jgi:nucleoside-diphosphate kinase